MLVRLAEPHVDGRAHGPAPGRRPRRGAGGGIGLGRVLEDEQRALLDGHARPRARPPQRRRRVVDPLDRPRDVELALTGEDGGDVGGGHLAGQTEAGPRVVGKAAAGHEEGQGPVLLGVGVGARRGVVVAPRDRPAARRSSGAILVHDRHRHTGFRADRRARPGAARRRPRLDPPRGDRFVVPERDLDDQVFVVSDMVIEAAGRAERPAVLAFNGTTEWALDSLEAQDAVWLPREDQLRTLLGDAFVSLERREAPVGGDIVTLADGGRHVDVDAACAYGRALWPVDVDRMKKTPRAALGVGGVGSAAHTRRRSRRPPRPRGPPGLSPRPARDPARRPGLSEGSSRRCWRTGRSTGSATHRAGPRVVVAGGRARPGVGRRSRPRRPRWRPAAHAGRPRAGPRLTSALSLVVHGRGLAGQVVAHAVGLAPRVAPGADLVVRTRPANRAWRAGSPSGPASVTSGSPRGRTRCSCCGYRRLELANLGGSARGPAGAAQLAG